MNGFLEKLKIKLTPRFIRRIYRLEEQLNNRLDKLYNLNNFNKNIYLVENKL